MGWLYKAPPPHRCIMPKEYVHTGSLWQCDECKRVWRCTTPGVIGIAWESVSKYRVVRRINDFLNDWSWV